jgi:nicotinamide mononucleotide adenylyltransferase
MTFNETYDRYMSTLLLEGQNDIIAIFPGGFKPPHKGHYELVKAYSSDPNIFEVKILLGPKERHSKSKAIKITEDMSREVWEQYYIPKLPGNVSIDESPDPVPVRAAYVYVDEVAEENEWVTLMSSVKDEKDARRSREFAEKHHPDTGKYYREGVNVIYYPKDVVAHYRGRTDNNNHDSISASVMREDIAVMDLDNFTTNLPDEVKDDAEKILKIFNPAGNISTDLTDLE